MTIINRFQNAMYVILYAGGIAMNAKLIFAKIILCNIRKKDCVKKSYNSYSIL
ncbi:hypothetical protein NARC_50016 [Candidatus Nitrosocosmicus arcticus]|uniref:Uncharacterized protein n=1 Tax=Candidatus Nitrosocosmicus arcticus TaxID=2035267 RepID=A0A557SW55_9ARCH|nr:hypothetical protein NARC_50016 [Candidatus Nitrosocosmicus arcticus]